ncbi:MAG: chromosome segregation protein SMC [Alicyclobacillaceae bacterium]|nr:chromosome segregation protein SMC [Alicyclobacillaceae bacterium]
MFLKRLDVMGFKSFADRTSIEFAPGITAVVGPNGSGKSNIADAIRWVLGEQSARALRGGKMEDVIFAGSEHRRPINFCEVSLTLDNADHQLPVVYDEVTITRRVYRSGESEYLLNKQPCRLKDIAELFMDTGLGREAYSIIGQGRIEEMLSTRPEDRRGPFEDAAGIVKFKFRRREAERKLEETGANLVRIDDLLAELRRQAEPLEREAERARAYIALRDELTALDVSLLVHDIDVLRLRWREAVEAAQQLGRLRAQEAAALAALEGDFRARREQLDACIRTVEQRQADWVKAVEERERAEGQLKLLQERLQHVQSTIAERHRQLEELATEQAALGNQVQALDRQLAQAEAELEAKAAAVEAAAARVDPHVREQLEREVARRQAELIEAHSQSARLRNELKQAEDALVSGRERLHRLQAEQQQWAAEADELDAAMRRLADQRQALVEQIQHMRDEVSAALRRQREAAAKEAEVAARIQRLQAELAAAQSRAELLKELEEGYDGYALGVRTVLQSAAAGRLRGVHGAIAQLIRVPGDLELAIETALGPALQYVVVDGEAEARAAIAHLKQRQAGRATFVPLAVVRPRRLTAAELEKLSGKPGFIGVASDLVRCADAHRRAVEHLLGNVVVASSLEAAGALARSLEYRVRVVTLEGDVVSPGGLMSGGGHARRGPGLLGRARERDELAARLQDMRQERDALEQERARLREAVSALVHQQQQWTGQIQQLQAALADMEASARETRARWQSACERREAAAWELAQLEEGRGELNERVRSLQASLTAAESSLAAAEQALAEARARLEQWDREQAEMQEALTARRVEVATLTQERAGLRERLAELRVRTDRLERQRRQWLDDVAGGERTAAEISEQLAATAAHVAQRADEVRLCQEELAALADDRRHMEADVAAAENQLRQQQEAVAALDAELHRAEAAADRIDVELGHLLRRLAETYRMTYEWAREHQPPPADADAVRRRLSELERRIEAMGDVQVGAVEEWQRLSERIRFLESERDDLEEASSRLRDVIADIDAEMARRFADTFAQIRSEFAACFRQLFGGGRADLELTDERDVLHAGIEVIAQPPGKKLQNLNLLSGGERALTAMALLFAILRVRPVPFCVLDEVEAALDEANVGRFAAQLRRFAADTQFIVITHRRGTMEEADALYGVTMQESGVSTLVSVRLADEADFETA